jgi:DNA-binding NarL/FixJ family response regulator
MIQMLVATARLPTRSALRALLATEPDLQLVGMSGDLVTTIRMIRSARPDAVLVDRTVLGGVGFNQLSLLTRQAPGVAIFLIGMGDHPQMDAYARGEGAAGYIRLDEAPERISDALTSVAAPRVA